MTKQQENDLLTKWSCYQPTEQRLMIEEYLNISDRKDCNKNKFLKFLNNKMEDDRYRDKIG